MKLIEEVNDLFNYEGKAWLAHCISSDFGMGNGIVLEFNKRYNLKNHMIKNYIRDSWCGKGFCIPVKEFNIFNLVTKRKYFQKPTYETLKQSLIDMKSYALYYNIETIAIPRIGCGLDGLIWDNVKSIIETVFKDTDIKIIVCTLKEDTNEL